MTERQTGLLDRLLGELDSALRTVAAPAHAVRPSPGAPSTEELGASERQLSARLMRVNHSGEIAAQALYRGQALVATDASLRAELLAAAAEENDHLAWCQARAAALGGGTSVFTPLWYAGSFALGAVAGLGGDKRSLGFLAETEAQVARHLDEHLEKLPAADAESRAILAQMRTEELNHGRATELGASKLPEPVKKAMHLLSRIMTKTSYVA